jgi:transcriptional regulator with XRE-family HTH domain
MTNRVRELRVGAGLTIEAMANALSVSKAQVSMLETGHRRLTVDWLIRIAEVLQCHPWLLVSDGADLAANAQEQAVLRRHREWQTNGRAARIEGRTWVSSSRRD